MLSACSSARDWARTVGMRKHDAHPSIFISIEQMVLRLSRPSSTVRSRELHASLKVRLYQVGKHYNKDVASCLRLSPHVDTAYLKMRTLAHAEILLNLGEILAAIVDHFLIGYLSGRIGCDKVRPVQP
jgi:hypothetical protein